jgi:hypothetical protein
MILRFFIFIGLTLSLIPQAMAQQSELPPISDEDELVEASTVMDGVIVEAIETYVNPKKHSVALGLALYPFNSYYNAFGITPSYTHQFSDSFGWEVLNFGFFSTVDKGLTTELADSFGVNPQVIDRLKFTLASHLLFTAAYGKVVLFSSNIRYFRLAPMVGGAYIGTKLISGFGPSFGARLDFSLTDTFQWRFEVKNSMIVTNGVTNFVTFTLGTGISF